MGARLWCVPTLISVLWASQTGAWALAKPGSATAARGLRSRGGTSSPTALEAGVADLTYVSPPASDAAGQVASPPTFPRGLYSEIEPTRSGLLAVGDGHELYWEESGNPDGVPAVFLHGGPGAGCSADSRRFFDPTFYRIVCFDQRGAGRSVPNAADDLEASLVENNTPKLVADVEALRAHLGVGAWGVVLGGSWGSTLALAYAQAHPDRLSCLLLRGVFTFCPDEVEYLFVDGRTAGQNPAAWERYLAFLRETSPSAARWDCERADPLGAYWQRLTSPDAALRARAAAAFVGYELSISKAFIDPGIIERYLGTPSVLIPFAVMEVHYMRNGGFLRRGQLLEPAGLAQMVVYGHHIAVAHGRADYVCQPLAAWRLARALAAEGLPDDRMSLEIVAGAGHSDSEPGLVDAMVRATDAFRDGPLRVQT